MSQTLPYYLDPGPGTGGRPPRTTSTSDSPRVSLDGDWRFRLVPTVADGTAGFEAPSFDDADWATLPVPRTGSCTATARPAYTNVQYPFPVDPPLRARREPDRRLPARFRRCPTTGRAATRCCASTASTRAFAVWLQRHGARHRQGQPAAGRVRRSASCCGPAGTCSRCGCTSGRPAATWRTRTSGGCPGSSATVTLMRPARRRRCRRLLRARRLRPRDRRRAAARRHPSCPALLSIRELGRRRRAGRRGARVH